MLGLYANFHIFVVLTNSKYENIKKEKVVPIKRFCTSY